MEVTAAPVADYSSTRWSIPSGKWGLPNGLIFHSALATNHLPSNRRAVPKFPHLTHFDTEFMDMPVGLFTSVPYDGCGV
jgi:hypothetical protein